MAVLRWRVASVACVLAAVTAVAALASAGAAPAAGAAQPAGPRAQESLPLPDEKAFLAETRKRLRSNDLVRSQYVYRQTDTRVSRDSDGRATKTEVRVFEVFPAPERELTYRRLVLVNGVQPSSLAQKDREQAEKVRKWLAAREREGVSAREKRLREQAEADRHEAEVVEEALALYRITMIGRESIAGRPTIAFTLEPRPEYKARTKEAGIIKKFKGRAWIDEQDHELTRLEMEAIESVTIGFGVVARLYAGSRAVIDRRKVDGDTWLPSRSHFVGGGRLLLVKRIDIDQLSEYADYRKPTADTTTTFTFPK
jgi:hypothetical protein